MVIIMQIMTMKILRTLIRSKIPNTGLTMDLYIGGFRADNMAYMVRYLCHCKVMMNVLFVNDISIYLY